MEAQPIVGRLWPKHTRHTEKETYSTGWMTSFTRSFPSPARKNSVARNVKYVLLLLSLSDVVWRLFAQYYGAPLKLLIYFLFSWQRKILNVRTNIIISNNNRGVIATIQRSSLVCGWFVCFFSCCLNGAHLCSISIKNCSRRRCLRLHVSPSHMYIII